jgi:hypothetical protein
MKRPAMTAELVRGLSKRRREAELGLLRVGSVVKKLALRQDFKRIFQFPVKGLCPGNSGFPLPVPFNQCSVLVYYSSVTEAVRM